MNHGGATTALSRTEVVVGRSSRLVDAIQYCSRDEDAPTAGLTVVPVIDANEKQKRLSFGLRSGARQT